MLTLLQWCDDTLQQRYTVITFENIFKNGCAVNATVVFGFQMLSLRITATMGQCTIATVSAVSFLSKVSTEGTQSMKNRPITPHKHSNTHIYESTPSFGVLRVNTPSHITHIFHPIQFYTPNPIHFHSNHSNSFFPFIFNHINSIQYQLLRLPSLMQLYTTFGCLKPFSRSVANII